MTKIVRGGTGRRVLSADARSGPYLAITSEYPTQSTFVNTNQTLLPPNTLIVGNGPNLANQKFLPTATNQYHLLPMNILENEWYNITTSATAQTRASLSRALSAQQYQLVALEVEHLDLSWIKLHM